MKTLIKDVNYDFPKCGGYIVRENHIYYFVMFYSNFQGSSDGIGYKVAKDKISKDDFLKLCETHSEYDFDMMCYNGHLEIECYNKGHVVK